MEGSLEIVPEGGRLQGGSMAPTPVGQATDDCGASAPGVATGGAQKGAAAFPYPSFFSLKKTQGKSCDLRREDPSPPGQGDSKPLQQSPPAASCAQLGDGAAEARLPPSKEGGGKKLPKKEDAPRKATGDDLATGLPLGQGSAEQVQQSTPTGNRSNNDAQMEERGDRIDGVSPPSMDSASTEATGAGKSTGRLRPQAGGAQDASLDRFLELWGDGSESPTDSPRQGEDAEEERQEPQKQGQKKLPEAEAAKGTAKPLGAKIKKSGYWVVRVDAKGVESLVSQTDFEENDIPPTEIVEETRSLFFGVQNGKEDREAATMSWMNH